MTTSTRTGKVPSPQHRVSKNELRRIAAARKRRRKQVKAALWIAGAAVVIATLVGAGVFSGPGGTAEGNAQFPYQVGTPHPGQSAPGFRLASADGSTFDLASLQGKTVLLFFQEGVMCEPCWTQIHDIEKDMGRFRAAGIDALVSITTDPVDVIRQKVRDEKLTSVNLADPGARVSKQYGATAFSMPGHVDTDGHSFVLVKDGRVVNRADYGGAPNYSMYVPVDRLIADIAPRQS